MSMMGGNPDSSEDGAATTAPGLLLIIGRFPLCRIRERAGRLRQSQADESVSVRPPSCEWLLRERVDFPSYSSGGKVCFEYSETARERVRQSISQVLPGSAALCPDRETPCQSRALPYSFAPYGRWCRKAYAEISLWFALSLLH